MKKVWILLWNSARRNRGFALLALACGILLCAFYGFLGSMAKDEKTGGIPVGILDSDNGVLSQNLCDYLSQEQGMILTKSINYDELSSELIERHISAIIEIPKGFQAGAESGTVPELTMTTLDDYENAAFLQSYLDSYLTSIRILSKGAAGDTTKFSAMLNKLPTYTTPVEEKSALALTPQQVAQREGFTMCLGFFLMLCFPLGMSLSNLVFSDRTSGLYQRTQIASVKPIQYVTGICLFGAANCCLLILVFFSYVFLGGYDIGLPAGIPVLLAFLYCLFIVGISLVLGLVLYSKNTISTVIIGGATVTCLLGGAYFPLELAPDFLQKLARLTPQFWFMDALRGTQESADYPWHINAMILGLFALLCFLIAGIRFSKSRTEARV